MLHPIFFLVRPQKTTHYFRLGRVPSGRFIYSARLTRAFLLRFALLLFCLIFSIKSTKFTPSTLFLFNTPFHFVSFVVRSSVATCLALLPLWKYPCFYLSSISQHVPSSLTCTSILYLLHFSFLYFLRIFIASLLYLYCICIGSVRVSNVFPTFSNFRATLLYPFNSCSFQFQTLLNHCINLISFHSI